MDQLPPELMAIVVLALIGEGKTLEALAEVFPGDAVIEKASQACQAITVGYGINQFVNSKIPHRNVHDGVKILSRELPYFHYPVDILSLYIRSQKAYRSWSSCEAASKSHETMLKQLHQIFTKEPNLLHVRKLEIHFSCDEAVPFIGRRNKEAGMAKLLDLQKLLFFDSCSLSGVKPKHRLPKHRLPKHRFPKLKELVIDYPLLLEVPELPHLQKLEIKSGYHTTLETLEKLSNLKEFRLHQKFAWEYQHLRAPKLELLSLKFETSSMYDNFDKFIPNLKTLDLSKNKLDRVPKLVGTNLEELRMDLEDGLDLRNLSNLKSLKKLTVVGKSFQLDGISHLQNLEYLKLRCSSYLSTGKMIELNDKLPVNLETLLIYRLPIPKIEQMPSKLQRLNLSDTGITTIENISPVLSILKVVGSSLREIKCNLSTLTNVVLGDSYKREAHTFVFHDGSSNNLEHELFKRYCHMNNINYFRSQLLKAEGTSSN